MIQFEGNACRSPVTTRWPIGFRSGLTLLELMVVLVILAIVATVALQTLQPRVAQQRFDAATAMLKQIQDATIGSREKYQLDGTPLISGFVADVGRTPSITPGAITTNNQDAILPQQPSLAELWEPESKWKLLSQWGFR
ncbi:MAG: type II secretion system protein, partial [Planctomycetota bacterium]